MKNYLLLIPVLLFMSCYLDWDLQYEDNFADSYYTAYYISVNSRFSDSFSRDEDIDIYKFYATEGDNITIEISAYVNMTVMVLDQYHTTLEYTSNSSYDSEFFLNLTIPANGLYYIRLYPMGYYNTGPYNLHIYSTNYREIKG